MLNHILTQEHGKKIVVIENEFGEIDIDGEIVHREKSENEDILLLNNGCLCCSVRGDLVEMLTKLYETRKGEFDHVVIETTGLANPAPIIQTFYLEHALLENFRVDGVVTLVDAKHAHLHLDEVKPDGVVNEALEQIAFADRIVLNKTDLVTEETELNGLHRRIREINALAEIQRATKAKVPLDFTLGIGGFDLEKVQEAVMGKEQQQQQQQQKDGHGHSHDEHNTNTNTVIPTTPWWNPERLSATILRTRTRTVTRTTRSSNPAKSFATTLRTPTPTVTPTLTTTMPSALSLSSWTVTSIWIKSTTGLAFY